MKTDSWEQRKLGEVTSIKSAARVHRDDWCSSGVPFYRSSDVMAAFNGTPNEKVYIPHDLFDKLASRTGSPKRGDVMVTGGGSVGIPYVVPDDMPFYTKDADLIWIRRCEWLDSEFLYFYFVAPRFRAYIRSISHVGTIAHYTIEQVAETTVQFPANLAEQRKIGAFFADLDHLITLRQRELSTLNSKPCPHYPDDYAIEKRFRWQNRAIRVRLTPP